MAADWTFYAANLVTGDLAVELLLVDFQGSIALTGGSFSARLRVSHLDDADRFAAIESTRPGMYTLVAFRDNVVVGEWVIWKRTRKDGQGPIELSGSPIQSILTHRITPAWSWTNTEQLTIARTMLTYGFGGNPSGGAGAVEVTVPVPTPSGMARDRTYLAGDSDIGTRLKELSEVENGFELIISTTQGAGASYVYRTANLYYPRAGIDRSMVFEFAGPNSPPGTIYTSQVDEDATILASKTWAIGSKSTNATLIGYYTDTALVTAGYPFLEKSASYTTVSTQTVINGHARGMWDSAQIADSPSDFVIRADATPGLADIGLGDRVTILIESSPNFPGGYMGNVRIVGMEFKPLQQGSEMVTLNVAKEG